MSGSFLKHFSMMVSLAVATAPSVTADAADLPAKAPAFKAPAMSWTGCYVGAAGGGNWGRSRAVESTGIPITNSFNLSGVILGGTLGCNYQADMWVIGVETDFSWTNFKGSAHDIDPFDTTAINTHSEKWLGTIRGRIGNAWGNELLYVTGGLAYARVEIENDGGSSGLGSASEAKMRAGWTIGGGWEHRLTSNLSAKLEYLYVDLGNGEFFKPPPPGFSDRAGGVRFYDHIVRAGLNFKFW